MFFEYWIWRRTLISANHSPVRLDHVYIPILYWPLVIYIHNAQQHAGIYVRSTQTACGERACLINSFPRRDWRQMVQIGWKSERQAAGLRPGCVPSGDAVGTARRSVCVFERAMLYCSCWHLGLGWAHSLIPNNWKSRRLTTPINAPSLRASED